MPGAGEEDRFRFLNALSIATGTAEKSISVYSELARPLSPSRHRLAGQRPRLYVCADVAPVGRRNGATRRRWPMRPAR